jgi:carboxymethylenebutenolidase
MDRDTMNPYDTAGETKADPRGLQPPLRVDQRGFFKASIGAGFAAAVQPVTARTMITTDTQGLTAGDIRIPAGDREIAGYHAQPAGTTGLATVLVVQEIFGVHEYIKDVCRRLAKLGYVAVAPDLYARQGDVSNMQIDDIVANVVAKVSDAQVMGDLDAAARWAAGHGGEGKLGVTGFCWGGRIVWMYAAHRPDLAAGVAWYGGVANGRYPGDKGAIEVVDRIKAPILGLYGGADPGIPNDSVERMRAALKTAGNTRSEIITYPETPHAFHADYRPSYRKAAAEDGWKRLTAWFRQYLA